MLYVREFCHLSLGVKNYSLDAFKLQVIRDWEKSIVPAFGMAFVFFPGSVLKGFLSLKKYLFIHETAKPGDHENQV